MIEEQRGWNEKYCCECGRIIPTKAEMCPLCGVRQFKPYASSRVSGRRLAAALLAIFLGSFGAHKFYLGKTQQGILFLVFCWTMIPLLFGLCEGIQYLVMGEEAFVARYS